MCSLYFFHFVKDQSIPEDRRQMTGKTPACSLLTSKTYFYYLATSNADFLFLMT